MATYSFHAISDVGRQREQNEDSCGEQEVAGGVLLVVCDGMGGHSSGEVASRLAVDAIAQIFANSPSDDLSERLRNGFLVANQRILAHAEKEGIDSMGTTAVASYVRDGETWIAHVGDSRVYHVRGGAVLWKTADHTRVQKMVERGILSAEEAKTHADANVVTRALGFAKGEELPEPDVTPRPLREGDVLVLCTDGLTDLVKDEEIAELADGRPPSTVSRTLVDLANSRGGHDNVTVAVLRWGDAVAAASTLSGSKPPRKTAREDDAVEAPAPTPAAAAPAPAAPAGSRKMLSVVLIIAAIAVIAIAAFMLGKSGRGGGAAPASGAGPDARAKAAMNDAGAPAIAADAGAAAAANADAGGKAPPPPTWDSTDPSRPRQPRRDGGVPTPRTDGGVPAVKVDGGAATGVPVDAGIAPRPRNDAGLPTPRVPPDAGTPRPRAVDAGVPAQPPKPKVDAGPAGSPKLKPDAGMPPRNPPSRRSADGGAQ